MKFRFALSALCVLITGANAAIARVDSDCAGQWVNAPAHDFPGVNGTVYASILWDPDGSGPLTPQLVIGGDFTAVGGVATGCLATCDPLTFEWRALAPPITHTSTPVVYALALLPNASNGTDLLVAGRFSAVGGVPAASVARWNGSAWNSMSNGITSATVRALHVSPSLQGQTEIYVGGSFPSVLRWDGAKWVTLGGTTSLSDTVVYAIGRLPGGDLVVGGTFSRLGDSASGGLVRWNGSAWVPMVPNSPGVYSLVVCADGSLVVGGAFTTFDGKTMNRIARWDGSSWSSLDSGLARTSSPFDAARVWSLAQLPSGEIVAAGYFLTAGGKGAFNIAVWNGSTWQPMGAGLFGLEFRAVYTLALLPSSGLFAGGDFTSAGSGSTRGIAVWRDQNWAVAASGLNGPVFALAAGSNADTWLAGDFTSAGARPASYVARLIGGRLFPLGAGLDSPALCLSQIASGELIVGGEFLRAGEQSAPHLARWNGTAWSAFAGGTDGTVRALAPLPGGALLTAGSFTHAGTVPASSVALWTGSQWLALGAGIQGAVNTVLASAPDDIIVGGDFSLAGNSPASNIARWNGSSWSPLGPGFDGRVLALVRAPNGDLYAGGEFDHAGAASCRRIARWDGNSWSPLAQGLGAGVVNSLCVFPSGDLIAAGTFTTAGANITRRAARWADNTWTSFGSGFDAPVYAVAARPNKSVLFGGTFSSIDHLPASYVAHLSYAACCPADLNSDALVDDADFVIFLAGYNILDCADPSMPPLCPGDLNSDSMVDDTDFVSFVAAYNELVCP